MCELIIKCVQPNYVNAHDADGNKRRRRRALTLASMQRSDYEDEPHGSGENTLVPSQVLAQGRFGQVSAVPSVTGEIFALKTF